MEYTYFLTQLTQLTHAPFILYNKETGELVFQEMRRQLSTEEQSRFEAVFQPKPGEYPRVLVMEELVLIQIPDQSGEKKWIFAGPVIPGNVEEKAYNSICKKHKELAEWGFPLHMCSMKQLVSGALALYWTMTGTELSQDQFWEKNREQFASVKQIFPRLTKDIFEHQENRGPHNPFEQEQRELESIRNGDTDALKNSMAETYEGELGILAKNPLRHHKNVAIGNITLASRAAIQGGAQCRTVFLHGGQPDPAGGGDRKCAGGRGV